ncbi:hypothetical protein [Stutzerimonas nitrititolerans]|uniref:hypothetical protein n=1 Tax=Stutzerimonas nitrititolerans TaxID=2482751 RepID=UPI0028AC5B89|nr:hypothetical protein [Stutzerimonas nitrititolerans]
MNFTTYQALAFIGAVAGMAIVFGLGYAEGRRKAREHLTQALGNYREQIGHLRERAHRIQRDLDSCRLNAAQALEGMTEELDACKAKLATAEARALTEEDAADLATMAAKLSIAADLFANLTAADQAQTCRRLAKVARQLHDRYWQSLPVLGVVA